MICMSTTMKAKYYVYYNLHKHCFSVKYKGRVIIHSNTLVLGGHVEFRVSQAGRRRVLEEKRKNVHAYVVGDWVYVQDVPIDNSATEVRYNPYKGPRFTSKGSPLLEWEGESLLQHGKVFII